MVAVRRPWRRPRPERLRWRWLGRVRAWGKAHRGGDGVACGGAEEGHGVAGRVAAMEPCSAGNGDSGRVRARGEPSEAKEEREGVERDGKALRCSSTSAAGRMARGEARGTCPAKAGVPCCLVAMRTKRRARGRRLYARLGGQFWAGSVHFWAKGLEPKLLTTACSTFSI
jgi:hypothetical protein